MLLFAGPLRNVGNPQNSLSQSAPPTPFSRCCIRACLGRTREDKNQRVFCLFVIHYEVLRRFIHDSVIVPQMDHNCL